MHGATSLQQEDISFLFWLDYERVKELPKCVATRLLAHGLVTEAEPHHGSHVPELGAVYVTVSPAGCDLMTSIAAGANQDFRVPNL